MRSKHTPSTTALGVALCCLFAGAGCGSDDPPTDAGTPDVSTDVQGDASNDVEGDVPIDVSMTCGNGALDPSEACDGTMIRDGVTCTSLGLPDGQIGCSATCDAVDTATCAVCGDAICSDAETSASCAQDCGVKSIAAAKTHTCAALADGSLWCWGAAEGHQMGGTGDTTVPVRVPGHDNVVQVSAGDHHTCFVNTSDEVWCFGANGFGEVGPSTDHFVFPPTRVESSAFSTATKVVAGGNHTCAIDATDGDVFCWGRGDYGQRGDGRFQTRRGDPTLIVPDPQTSAALDLALGTTNTCEVLDTNVVRCWGDNSRGWLGSERVWRNRPYTILALPGLRLTSASVGDSHVCVNTERSDGSMKQFGCFGGNAYGQLGSAPSTDVLTGTTFPGPAGAVATGFSYTCAQDLSGSPALRCWGDNYHGQLGDGTFDAHFAPANVVGIDDVTSLAGGHDHVCAILPDETARCWGKNREGQLGNGSDEWAFSEPVVPAGLGPADGGER